jgi:hypothetical protein
MKGVPDQMRSSVWQLILDPHFDREHGSRASVVPL